MRFIQKTLFAFGFVAIATTASYAAEQSATMAGYLTLPKAQETESAQKVEVTEFFSYACDHCYAFESALTEWVAKQGEKIKFKRVPTAFRETYIPQQKLYYALEALGKSEEMQRKIYSAIHDSHQALETDDAIVEFVVKNGIDKQKFLDAYNSPEVQDKVVQATRMQGGYEVNMVPVLAIAGRFITSPSMVRPDNLPEPAQSAAVLKLTSDLVEESKKP